MKHTDVVGRYGQDLPYAHSLCGNNALNLWRSTRKSFEAVPEEPPVFPKERPAVKLGPQT